MRVTRPLTRWRTVNIIYALRRSAGTDRRNAGRPTIDTSARSNLTCSVYRSALSPQPARACRNSMANDDNEYESWSSCRRSLPRWKKICLSTAVVVVAAAAVGLLPASSADQRLPRLDAGSSSAYTGKWRRNGQTVEFELTQNGRGFNPSCYFTEFSTILMLNKWDHVQFLAMFLIPSYVFFWKWDARVLLFGHKLVICT